MSTLKTLKTSRRLGERLNYDIASKNPLARVSKSYPKKGVSTQKGNGFDKPLNNMSAPYGAYSVVLRAYAKGEPIVSDKV